MGDLASLRRHIRSQRRAITGQKREILSQQTAQQIISWLRTKPDVYRIATFLSLPEEIDTCWLNNRLWQLGYLLYLPYVREKKQPLQWLAYRPETVLAPDCCKISAPCYDISRCLKTTALDVVITPLVAWDKYGTRLGMGGGFYDRTFQGKMPGIAPWLIGMAYPCQYLDKLERQLWDIPLDAVAVAHTIFNYPQELTNNDYRTPRFNPD